ncbi:hypothetical protein NST62_07100 [Ureibacillus sp. FSL K6-8385]|nr:hypothetical protein [Ureibacillus terrenus]
MIKIRQFSKYAFHHNQNIIRQSRDTYSKAAIDPLIVRFGNSAINLPFQ